ncbi:MAG: serine/threonine-protein kinase [Polyangiaceae bacterium]
MTEIQQQRYRVVEKLEAGGMAEVFRAESEGLQGFRKQVAIKRVLPHLSEKKKFISMFLDEARLSAQLSHSNCVQVFDIGVGDNAYFIVMEYVDGGNLKAIAESLKKQGRDFPVPIAAFVGIEICKGLSYAHEVVDSNGQHLELVHRDMSPPNVLITKYGEVKIVDFGLAKASSQLEKSEPGIIKGKFAYLSPEAAMGQEVDPRTDIFAVGIILWELLTGQRLFLGDTDFQTVKKVQQAIVPPVSQINPKVPKELERIVNKALAKDPNARYQTARELAQDLTKFLFANGQAVGTFDVAALVQLTVRDKSKVRAPQGSIIDKLIEEALFEFTSLKEEETGRGVVVKATPNNAARPLDAASFVDPTNWATEIGQLPQSESQRRPQEESLRASLRSLPEEGNLSALEDASPPLPAATPAMLAAPRLPTPPAMGVQAAPGMTMPKPGAPGAAPPQPAKGAPPGKPGAATPAKSGSSSMLPIVLGLLFLLLVGGGAAAWFLKLIPH